MRFKKSGFNSSITLQTRSQVHPTPAQTRTLGVGGDSDDDGDCGDNDYADYDQAATATW